MEKVIFRLKELVQKYKKIEVEFTYDKGDEFYRVFLNGQLLAVVKKKGNTVVATIMKDVFYQYLDYSVGDNFYFWFEWLGSYDLYRYGVWSCTVKFSDV